LLRHMQRGSIQNINELREGHLKGHTKSVMRVYPQVMYHSDRPLLQTV
jgi:hypothetical protein